MDGRGGGRGGGQVGTRGRGAGAPRRGGGGGGGGRGGGRYPWRWMYNKRGGNRGGGGGARGGNKRANDDGEPQEDSEGLNRITGSRSDSGNYTGVYNNNDDGRTPPSHKRRKRADDGLQKIDKSLEKYWSKIFPGYRLYFYDGPPQLPDLEKKIATIETYLKEVGFSEDILSKTDTTIQDFYSICFEDLMENEAFVESWPEFESDLVNNPDHTIPLWSATAHKIIYKAMQEQEPNSDDSNPSRRSPIVPKLRVGFLKYQPATCVMDVKSSLVGKLITLKGSIVRAGNIRPYCQRMTFRCKICDTAFAIEQPEGKYTPPIRCMVSEECSNTSSFETLETASTTEMINSKHVKIQDVQQYDVEKGAVPRSLDCVLFGSLTNHCGAGDTVTLSGIVRMSRDDTFGAACEQSLHHMYLEASSVRQYKDSDIAMEGHFFSFTRKDYYAIEAIHDSPELFRLLIASLCPSIYGHELVKAGLLICLFGGTPRGTDSFIRRTDVNMLIVGDPGIGKSQMLKAVTAVAPKSVYICGTGSTLAGLTATLVKDGDDFSLDAGALVMADKGVCCVDEFDKMSSQHHAFLEALEQQTVSIAKSGVFRTLPARSAVIAASNPAGGHYDSSKTVSENIRISSALLSRFDLVFILLDTPDKEFDENIVHHAHQRGASKYAFACAGSSTNPKGGQLSTDFPQPPQRLIDKIKPKPGEVFDVIPHALLRKYIVYAKQYVRPKLSLEAANVLKKYYLNLRLSNKEIDSSPVTTRQLESLIRLAEARAKMELREVVTAEDASDVLEIFEFSLRSAYDEKVLAISSISSSVLVQSFSRSKKSLSLFGQAKAVASALKRAVEQECKSLFSVNEIRRIVADLGFQSSFDSIIAALNNEGFLLHKGGQTYKVQSVNF